MNFVHLAAMQAVVCLAMLYQFAKKNSGLLKPGVYLAEGTVKVVIGPVCERFRDVPFEFLKFLDRKVCISLSLARSLVCYAMVFCAYTVLGLRYRYSDFGVTTYLLPSPERNVRI